ncbi:PREDICTED: mucin-21 [Dufourea novaeangliae]|uniref:mucin-21 n=1 Tax=Dufourea novaeangliae TaxID=178035 RepID=UPI0007678673|nr:PREDICTED: mucin-21 [Dufourea novaeangliae]
MKSSALYNVLVLTVAYSFIVQGQQQACTCGDLGSGTNPCTCSQTVVKAAKLPTPTYYVSPQEINDAAAAAAAAARNSIVVSTGTSQNDYTNTQSGCGCNSVTYNNVQPNAYISSNTDTITQNSGSSSACSNSDSNTYSGGSSVGYNNGGIITYSNTDSNTPSNSNADTYSNSGTITYSSSSQPSSSVPSVAYADVTSPLDTSSQSDSGCGCNKQTLESLEIDDSTNSEGNIVPSFSPIGDLCYPLPFDSRSGKLIEKTRVTPAYPGKIVCNRCNTPEPYEVCVNMHTGETTSRAIISSSTDATDGSSPIVYGSQNSGPSSGSDSETFIATACGRNNAATDSASGLFSNSGLGSLGNLNSGTVSGTRAGLFGNFNSGRFGGARLGSFSGAVSGAVPGPFSGARSGLFGNLNSVTFGESQTGTYGKLNSGSLTRSDSRLYGVPPLVYTNSNTASGQKQYAGITISSDSSNCFDDDTDESQVDYSYPEMPADAVSLTLAYKNLRAPNVIYRQGKQFVPEDKLSFGHRTVPNDAKIEKKIIDIPEERLVTVEKPVVELKLAPPRTVVIGSYDEREEAKLAELEAIERESITQEETPDQIAEGLMTYKDLGYAPVGVTYTNSRGYNEMIDGEINDSMEEPCGPLGPPIPDYIPGTVMIQQDVPRDAFENSGTGEIRENIEFQRTNPSRVGPCAI